MRAEGEGHVAQGAGRAAGEHVDGLLYFEGVADVHAQGLIHIGDQRREAAAAEVADAHHVLGQFAGLFRRVHDGAGAGLDIEHHHVAAGGQFFREDGGDDQRQAVHRFGDVAQGVEHLVRRGQFGGLAGDGAADGADDGLELVHLQVNAHARDGLEFVQRAAGEAQPAAGHLRHLEAAGGREGHEDEAGGVAHAAGGVFVGLDAWDVL